MDKERIRRTEPPGEYDGLVERLRKQAIGSSAAMKLLADAKTARNHAAEGIPPGEPGYAWPPPERTIEAEAATAITALQSRIREVEAERDAAQQRAAFAEDEVLRAWNAFGPPGSDTTPVARTIEERTRAETAEAERDRLREALNEARKFVAEAPEDTWGFGTSHDPCRPGTLDEFRSWPIRDELLSKLDAALNKEPS